MLHFCLAFSWVLQSFVIFCVLFVWQCLSRVPVELDQWALLAPGQRRQASKGSQSFALDKMSTDVAHCSMRVTLSHICGCMI